MEPSVEELVAASEDPVNRAKRMLGGRRTEADMALRRRIVGDMPVDDGFLGDGIVFYEGRQVWPPV